MIAELGRRFPTATVVAHQWFEYQDRNGLGLCQTDAFIEARDAVVIFEAKLSGGFNGKSQLEGLYRPVLEKDTNKPVRCLLICKFAHPSLPGPFFDSPEDFIRSAAPYGAWQWLGQEA